MGEERDGAERKKWCSWKWRWGSFVHIFEFHVIICLGPGPVALGNVNPGSNNKAWICIIPSVEMCLWCEEPDRLHAPWRLTCQNDNKGKWGMNERLCSMNSRTEVNTRGEKPNVESGGTGEEEGSHRSHCITHCTCWFSETQAIAAGAEDTRQNHCCLDATVKSKLCAVVRKDRHCGGVNGDQIAKVFLVAVYLPYRKYGLEVTRRTLNPLCCLLIYSYWANINCQCWSEMQIWSRAQWTRTCGNLQLGDGFPSTFGRSHGPKARTSADWRLEYCCVLLFCVTCVRHNVESLFANGVI